MTWAIVAIAAGTAVTAGATYYGGQQAADAVPNPSDAAVAGYDPNADPLLAFLRAQASTGLGFAPDQNILDAGSPLNRLENNLTTSLGRIARRKDLIALNNALQAAQGIISEGAAAGTSASALSEQLETAFFGTRGERQQDLFASAQSIIAQGIADGKTPEEIAAELRPAYKLYMDDTGSTGGFLGHGPGQSNTGGGMNVNRFISEVSQMIESGQASGITTDAIARDFVNEFGKAEKQAGAAGLFRTALSSGGYDSIQDLVQQELDYRERALTQQESFNTLAGSRASARESANLTIDRLLRDYPAFGASDLQRASEMAIQPYQAQELEQANALGYNPATNLALTRTNGIRDALAILSGGQGLTNTALGSLSTILGGQVGEALAVSGQSQAAQANAANLASQQAMALNSLALQGGLFSGAATGGATAGAGALSGDALAQIIGQLGKQPGT